MLIASSTANNLGNKKYNINHVTCEYDEVVGGGCPNLTACANTCKKCDTGEGSVLAACLSKGSGQTDDFCRCYFLEGAPCLPGCASRTTFSIPRHRNVSSAT
ncbi:unnamed protein product [Amaranthus hypochondriacus]